MPADRVFGRIEKDLRTHEKIVSPREYYAIFAKHGHVRVLEDGWETFDYTGQQGFCPMNKNACFLCIFVR